MKTLPMRSAPTEDAPMLIDGGSLCVDDVLEVAHRRRAVSLAGDAARRAHASRELRVRLVAEGKPIYGVTTGFGDSADRQIDASAAAALQANLLRFLGCGTGPIASSEVTRATILLRANCLAKGNSGVRVELIERLLALIAADVLPLIPERGSCGASGDLIPLSYLGRLVVGDGPVAYRGAIRDAGDVLAELRLEPLELEAKEGLALTNGTSFMSAFACLAVGAARVLADVAEILTAMTSEAVLGNRAHFAEFLFDAKPHPGARRSGRNIREHLDGSMLTHDGSLDAPGLEGRACVRLEQHVQDRYSIRCAPHVIGVLRDTLEWVQRWLEIEINSSDDNPLFDTASGSVHSGGNFYGGHMGQAMDALKVAVANVCDLLDRQLELVVDEKFSGGLPPNLIVPVEPDHPDAGSHHGFKGMQLCCSAMTAEALKLTSPATVHSRSTESHNQDKVSMGTIAARDARTVCELAEGVAAVHLIALCQALELRDVRLASASARAVHGLVREHVALVDRDRPLDRDIGVIAGLVRSGVVAGVAGEAHEDRRLREVRA